ncbi:MAG TPA: YlzJ-like family protein [Bacillales bacterium]|nr:YlzJ-like family protein [Bacillales bacterium]
MILYTILPDQVVLDEEDEATEKADKQQLIEFDGRQILIEPLTENEWQIVRLLSSDPQDFLNPRYQPGNIVPVKPQI